MKRQQYIKSDKSAQSGGAALNGGIAAQRTVLLRRYIKSDKSAQSGGAALNGGIVAQRTAPLRPKNMSGRI